MPKTNPLIALVDDEQAICKAFTRLLRAAGLNVKTFDSGRAFLNWIDGQVPDCVLLDIHMPQMSGLAVQAQLAKANPRVPVIIITGHDAPENRARAIENGAAAYLRKPVDESVLLEAISTAIADANGTNAR